MGNKNLLIHRLRLDGALGVVTPECVRIGQAVYYNALEFFRLLYKHELVIKVSAAYGDFRRLIIRHEKHQLRERILRVREVYRHTR